MCKRQTKLMTILFENNKGMFESEAEILKVAEALKAKIECIKNNNTDYFVNVFIGMSRLNIRHGYYKYTDNHKPGRNKLIRVAKPHKNAKQLLEQPWHLHILIEANPGETICEQIADYFNKKFKRDIAHKYPVDEGFFPYTMKQCELIRYVVENRATALVKYNFKTIYGQNYKPLTKTDKKFRKLNNNFCPKVNNNLNKNNTAKLHSIIY